MLITGESGTGKEVVAEPIHPSVARRLRQLQLRRHARELIESELFGHERAPSPAPTRIARTLPPADGGTLFLDEISEMALDLRPNCCAL